MRAQELRIALAEGARLREELQAIAELSQQREEATAPECSQISGCGVPHVESRMPCYRGDRKETS